MSNSTSDASGSLDTETYLYNIINEVDTYSFFNKKTGKPFERLQNISADSVYVYGDNVLEIKQRSKYSFFNLETGEPFEKLQSIDVDSTDFNNENILIIKSGNNCSFFDSKTGSWLKHKQNIPHDSIYVYGGGICNDKPVNIHVKSWCCNKSVISIKDGVVSRIAPEYNLSKNTSLKNDAYKNALLIQDLNETKNKIRKLQQSIKRYITR